MREEEGDGKKFKLKIVDLEKNVNARASKKIRPKIKQIRGKKLRKDSDGHKTGENSFFFLSLFLLFFSSQRFMSVSVSSCACASMFALATPDPLRHAKAIYLIFRKSNSLHRRRSAHQHTRAPRRAHRTQPHTISLRVDVCKLREPQFVAPRQIRKRAQRDRGAEKRKKLFRGFHFVRATTVSNDICSYAINNVHLLANADFDFVIRRLARSVRSARPLRRCEDSSGGQKPKEEAERETLFVYREKNREPSSPINAVHS